MVLFDTRLHPRINPLWHRIPTWAAITFASVTQTHGVGLRVATGVLMVVGAGALQFANHPRTAVRRAAVLVTTAGGLAACFTAPKGIAEILVAVAASRFPNAVEGRALRWVTVLDALAFAGTVAFISRSVAGALAGISIPFLVQRSVEHRDLVRERDRAQALLAEAQAARENATQAAALRERARIAREMHDVLAHSLAGLSVQLQGVRAVAAREQVPAAVLDPLDRAAALAREGLDEARSVVGTLRDPGGLGLDELPALVERHPGDARLTVTGAAGRVPADAGHAVYRAVQESLTNAARYAPGSAVTVTLAWQEAALAVTVDDDGPAPGRTAVAGQGSGLGLAGMAERVGQAGGTLQAGPRPDGGWRIALEVPLAASAVTA